MKDGGSNRYLSCGSTLTKGNLSAFIGDSYNRTDGRLTHLCTFITMEDVTKVTIMKKMAFLVR